MKKILTLSLFFIGMAVSTFAEEANKVGEKSSSLEIKAQGKSLETETNEIPFETKRISMEVNFNSIIGDVDCYAGMTTCGRGYMFCTGVSLSPGDQLIFWDAFESLYCG